MAKGPHHTGTYQVRARRLRDAAYANPNTLCWTCNEPLRPGVPGKSKWTAGHVVDGQVDGLLMPEHDGCNYSRGAAMGNRKRGATPSRDWWN